MNMYAVTKALALTALLALAGVAQGQEYPAIAGDGCSIQNVPIPGFNPLLLLPVLDTLTSNAQAYGISSECMASATQNLVACLSDLGRLEGCCSSTCAAAINSVPEDCIAALTVGTCRMAADGLAVGPVLTPVFSVKRRCIDGVQDTCESIMVPPTTPSPIPSPVPSPVPSPLPVPSPMPTPVPSGSQYPAVVGDGCDIEDVPVPGFDREWDLDVSLGGDSS
uniref:Bifunctional inhibitor/plant lipid transfer protein/seed storage helical domain-containing protein n=1 Tax=Chlamydomonas euryale TaxID=1486919 RepID=A0A6U2JVL0_9CHLO|mmetsp:Transcript_8671/g.26308  ORF Transcript_8671/g.26308 Transcript_8671/m.26308 type:complete len:222 (+) Transcript_8671:201-866(+)